MLCNHWRQLDTPESYMHYNANMHLIMQARTGLWPSGAAPGPFSTGGRSRSLGRHKLTREDLVSVVPSDRKHMPLVKAMRGWRKVRLVPC